MSDVSSLKKSMPTISEKSESFTHIVNELNFVLINKLNIYYINLNLQKK